jgi:hypothetical protein
MSFSDRKLLFNSNEQIYNNVNINVVNIDFFTIYIFVILFKVYC